MKKDLESVNHLKHMPTSRAVKENKKLDTSHSGVNDISLSDREKQLLAEALLPIKDELLLLRKEIRSFIPLETETSQQVAEHIFASEGKFVRPALFFLSCKLCAYDGPHLLPIAAVCEYVHTASLLHDDVVDDSELRRNKPTANKSWGDQAAVLVGDLIYSRASELMAATGEMDLVETFARSIRKMSEGELLQLENICNFNFCTDTYLHLLSCKTGVWIGAACRAGAILSGLPTEKRDALEEFGHSIGIAFQLIDDALDYISKDEIFGKPTQADLLEGKVTLPVILLRDIATEDEKQLIIYILDKENISAEDVSVVSKLVQKYRTAQLTMNRAKAFTEKAIDLLHENFEENIQRDRLENLAKSLLLRVY
ncbi:MAG: polyprenyl synthetase family protein [Bdellovibrionota bacterium]